MGWERGGNKTKISRLKNQKMKLTKDGSNFVVTFIHGGTFTIISLLNALKIVFGKPIRVAR